MVFSDTIRSWASYSTTLVLNFHFSGIGTLKPTTQLLSCLPIISFMFSPPDSDLLQCRDGNAPPHFQQCLALCLGKG